jgi:hypothetical protein
MVDLEKLVKEKVLAIADGVNVKIDDELKFTVSYNNGVVIKFDSTVRVEIFALGPYRLFNLLNPTIESITILPESFKISINNMPDIEVKRDNSNG